MLRWATCSGLLVDSAFRRHVASRVQNPHVRKFWLEEYEGYPARFRAEAIAPIQNKVGAFVTNPVLHRIVGRAANSFDMRQVIDEGKILIVNLAKGKIGEDAAALLGAMLVSKVSLAALSRADVPEHTRRDFYLYADEFQNYTTLSLAAMLSELRKYRVNLILAHQYLAQLDLAHQKRDPRKRGHHYLVPPWHGGCRDSRKGILSDVCPGRSGEPAEPPDLSAADGGRHGVDSVQRRHREVVNPWNTLRTFWTLYFPDAGRNSSYLGGMRLGEALGNIP